MNRSGLTNWPKVIAKRIYWSFILVLLLYEAAFISFNLPLSCQNIPDKLKNAYTSDKIKQYLICKDAFEAESLTH